MSDRQAPKRNSVKRAASAVAAVTTMAISVLIGVVGTPGAWAQSPRLITQPSALPDARFEAASIKPITFVRPPLNEIDFSVQRAIAQASRHGTFHLPMTSLHFLIRIAYNANDDQIVEEPPWANSAMT